MRFVPVVAALTLTVVAVACTRAVRRPDDGTNRVRIVVLSDLNGPYGSAAYGPEVHYAVDLTVRAWQPDLVLIAGDMVAGQQPSLSDDRVRVMWAAFDSAVAAPLREAGIPLVFTLGNHDASGFPAHARDRHLAAEYWLGPAAAGVAAVPGGNYPFYYAAEHRGVFIAAIDATTSRTFADSVQIHWLQQTLQSDAARASAMRFVLGHVPLYAVAEGRNQPGEVQDEPDSLRALLEQHGVHLFISGHHHAYFPARRGALDMLHAGALGNGPRPLIGGTGEPYRTVTVLDMWPARDSMVDRTYRIGAGGLELVDPRSLPARIEGINGWILRRDDQP